MGTGLCFKETSCLGALQHCPLGGLEVWELLTLFESALCFMDEKREGGTEEGGGGQGGKGGEGRGRRKEGRNRVHPEAPCLSQILRRSEDGLLAKTFALSFRYVS